MIIRLDIMALICKKSFGHTLISFIKAMIFYKFAINIKTQNLSTFKIDHICDFHGEQDSINSI